MKLLAFVTVALCSFSTSVMAQTCSTSTQVVGTDLAGEIKTLRNTVTKLQSRADGQIFLVTELPDAFQDRVPDLPTAPAFREGLIGDDAALLWVCDADGNPAPSVDDYRAAISTFEEAVAGYEAEISTRAQAIEGLAEEAATAEEPDTAEAQVPDVEEAEPQENETAAVEDDENTGVADGEAPEDDLAEAESEATETDAEPVVQATPMLDADNPNLFRRALSLPSARLRTEPNVNADAAELSTFSVLYVFEETSANGVNWIKVSTSLREGTQGWVQADNTISWTNMLVMTFADKGQRNDALFFENDTTLGDIVGSFSYAAEAEAIYNSINAERERLASEGGDPQWDSRLVAIEPPFAVSFGEQPYLLPILDWRPELFDGTIETNLLKVAAIPADAEEIATTDTQSFNVDLNEAAAQDGEFRVGVVFVIDTTVSMSPFIDRTFDAIQSFYDSFQEFESASFVSFSLIGFRDEISSTPGVEYTTELFQVLDPDAPASQVLGNMRGVTEATSPTREFKEDGLAGIYDAITRNDWAPYDARLIVFISDASVRSGDDPLARERGQTPQSIAELARNNDIAIVPIHLLTEANQRNGNALEAEQQYRALAVTGDVNNDKYIAINAEDPDVFATEMLELTTSMAREIFTANSGEVINLAEQLELEELPRSNGATLAAAAVNEVFRAQLQSLATAADGSAPSFLAGWTTDRDMRNPQFESLEVKVFLTRNQLSSLDKQLGSIIDAFRSGGDDPQTFFDNLQSLAAQTATDPDVVRSDDRETMRTLLPTFLQNLPYTSQVLSLDREYWGDLSNATRSEFMEQLDSKRLSYQAIFEQTDLWQSFGSDDPSLQVTPVRLSILP